MKKAMLVMLCITNSQEKHVLLVCVLEVLREEKKTLTYIHLVQH